MTTSTATTTQVHRVYIKATPEAIWTAITTPEWSQRYGYGGFVDYGDLKAGSPYRALPSEEMKKGSAEMGYELPEVIIDGEILESDPPRKLVQTWRMLMDPTMAAEGFTRLTYEITGGDDGVSILTIVHDLDGAPNLAEIVGGNKIDEGAGGGWSMVLSDLKTLLETGTSFNE